MKKIFCSKCEKVIKRRINYIKKKIKEQGEDEERRFIIQQLEFLLEHGEHL